MFARSLNPRCLPQFRVFFWGAHLSFDLFQFSSGQPFEEKFTATIVVCKGILALR